ncbi:capsule biosynthesis protein [Roseobacter sp.]|uniref:capsule biosynthesis protein n=1 Tax=Roseobacter sp. TaxID=1907202 RepID=UPI00385D7B49
MTTKPTARKFRIKRRDPNALAPAANPQEPLAVEGSEPKPDAKNKVAKEARESEPSGSSSIADKLDAIRREGFNGRQLRMARRVAHKNDLSPTSDFDAVRLLRDMGIDPFQRSNMLQLVVSREPNETDGRAKEGSNNNSLDKLPQSVLEDKERKPEIDLSPAEMRNREIAEIQRDISKRRRKKLGMLMARLSFFVLFPTFLAGWYFYNVATPMYSTKSEFLILQADNQGGSGIGGLLSGTQFATSQDSIAVQSYLQSKDALLRLDRDVGFKSHFTQSDIDPVQRLTTNPSNEQAYKTFKKNVKVGYDPTEGVLRMEVIAADPLVSASFSRALIDYAEDRVNALSQQKRGDQMAEARASFENAERERRAAQEALVSLQIQGATLDPQAVIVGLRSQINTIELQLLEKELQLAALLDNTSPNQSRVEGARGDVRRLNDQLKELNARMIDASQGENSLAQLSVRIQMAQADLATRDLLLQSALQQMEQTRMEANRQVRYLTISVKPVPPEEASYPRKFENTVVAFLIFSGIYLMVSLTASILREQVTS